MEYSSSTFFLFLALALIVDPNAAKQRRRMDFSNELATIPLNLAESLSLPPPEIRAMDNESVKDDREVSAMIC